MDSAKFLSTKPVVNVMSGDCPMQLLIVEDNKINLRVIEQILTRMGYKPDSKENGLEALKAVELTHYDLIFMDLQMPIMGGIEATRRIKKLLGEKCPMITAFTANSLQTDQLACQEVGMDDFISKPTTPKRIEQVIRESYTKIKQKKQQRSC